MRPCVLPHDDFPQWSTLVSLPSCTSSKTFTADLCSSGWIGLHPRRSGGRQREVTVGRRGCLLVQSLGLGAQVPSGGKILLKWHLHSTRTYWRTAFRCLCSVGPAHFSTPYPASSVYSACAKQTPLHWALVTGARAPCKVSMQLSRARNPSYSDDTSWLRPIAVTCRCSDTYRSAEERWGHGLCDVPSARLF